MNQPEYYCEECGTVRVDQDGGTCLRCWEKIDEEANLEPYRRISSEMKKEAA